MNKLDNNVRIAQALQAATHHATQAPELVEGLAREALARFTLRATSTGGHEIATTWEDSGWYTCWSREDNFIDSHMAQDALEALAVHEEFVDRAHRGMRPEFRND